MFVIVYNNSVILGPMRWNRFRFENEIQEECDTQVTLQDKNDELYPVIVSEEVQILPVEKTQDPEFNPKTQFLNGPFWEFTNIAAIASYTAEDLPVDAVKNMLKEKVTANRWVKENAGVAVTLNEVEYKFASDKETRATLQNAAANMDSINWKIDREVWVQMTKEQTQTVLNTILAYVQTCFDWEFSKFQEIDLCETLEQLDAVNVEE